MDEIVWYFTFPPNIFIVNLMNPYNTSASMEIFFLSIVALALRTYSNGSSSDLIHKGNITTPMKLPHLHFEPFVIIYQQDPTVSYLILSSYCTLIIVKHRFVRCKYKTVVLLILPWSLFLVLDLQLLYPGDVFPLRIFSSQSLDLHLVFKILKIIVNDILQKKLIL